MYFPQCGAGKIIFPQRPDEMAVKVKLWILSDWHMEQRFGGFAPPRPEFDVLICAGDVSNDIVEAIGMVRALAAEKLAVFVAGNHEYWGDMTTQATLERGHAAAARAGVAFLECTSIDIGGALRVGGATLWDEDDRRHWPSTQALAEMRADVVVTHFPPPPLAIPFVGPALWIYGHHHGHSDRRAENTRIVRNAAGGPNEPMGEPARLDFVVEI